MATIQIVLQAINDASQAFEEVTIAALETDEALRNLTAQLDATQRATADFGREAAAAGVAASDLRRSIDDLAGAADTTNVAFAALAATSADLDRNMFDLGSSTIQLDLAFAAAANRATDLRNALAGAASAALANAAATAQATSNIRDLRTAAGGAAMTLAALSAAQYRNAAAATTAAAAGRGWFGIWGALGTKIPLWGGLLDGLLPKMLTQVGGWHLLGDAIIEVMAVWGPAIIAVGAWGAAASDAINNIVRHMTDLHTVSDATGQAIAPMTNNLEQLHKAVQPQVYQLFGDALTVAAKRGGELNTVIMQTGQVLDQLGARAAVAIQSSQFSAFLKNAVTDVRLLGTAFGNLFGILGNLIRMNAGWATILLQTGVAILGLIERVTSLIIPLGQLLVLGHGFVIWVGLAVTAAVKFGSLLLGWGAALVTGAADLAGLVGMLALYVQSVGLATAAQAAFDAVNPFVWVGVAVGALTGLVLWVNSSKDATQQWGDAMQTALQNAQSLSQGVTLLTNDQVLATQKVTQATAQLNATTPTEVAGYAARYAGAQVLNSAYAQQATKVSELTGIQKQLAGQAQTYNTRLNDLAKTYGGVSNAQGLLVTSGITMAQMLDKSGQAWEIIKQQVAAAYAGYVAMGTQAGTLGNDMQVLDKQATDQYAAIQKLNQGWDTQTQAMTGAMTAFDTVAQGFATLSSGTAKFSESLGRLRVTGINFVKSGIDQLTPLGIALNQAFAQQVGTINSLADSWRSAGLGAGQFNSGLAAAIAPMEKYAAGSQEATAQLVGLAQEAGYQGPISLDKLNSYLGITSGMLKNTGGDMKTMQAAAAQATIQEALLTTAMQAQGSYIAGQLIGDINNAILKYHGVAQAATAYGNAVAQFGKQSQQAQTAQKILTDGMIAVGEGRRGLPPRRSPR